MIASKVMPHCRTAARAVRYTKPKNAAAHGRRSMAIKSQQQGKNGDIAPRQDQPSAAIEHRGWPSMMPSMPMMPGRFGSLFREMEEEMNNMMRAFGGTALELPSTGGLPSLAKPLAVDIKDMGDHMEIVADTPGLRKEDLKITVSPDRVLTISGERKEEKHTEPEKEGGFVRIERSFGSFMRRFRLPENVDLDHIAAESKDGVLRVSVPKTEAAQPKHIDVKIA